MSSGAYDDVPIFPSTLYPPSELTFASVLPSAHAVLEGLCASPEGWGPWSESRLLDFTPCFENAVLLTIPNLFLLAFGIPRLVGLLSTPSPSVPRGRIYQSKMLLGFLALLISIFDFAFVFVSGASQDGTRILAASLAVVAYGFALGLHEVEYFKARISSTVLLLFWMMLAVALSLKIRTDVLIGEDPVVVYSATFKLFLAVSMFILENVPKPENYYVSLDDDPNVSPEEHASIFSRISFHWMDALMKLGYRKDLDMDDLWNLRQIDSSRTNSDAFQHAWSSEMERKGPSLLRVLLRVYGPTFASAALFKFIFDILQFVQPQFLKMILQFAGSWDHPSEASPPQPLYRGVSIALLIFGGALIQTAVLHQYFHICLMTGMRLRAALVTAVYQKALRLSNKSRQGSTVGEIVNLMAVDSSRLMDNCQYLHILWSGPFQISLALYFLYDTLGPSIFVGVSIMLIMIPINAYLASKSRALNKVQMKNKDSRTKMMDELLNGIKVIKLYAWEKSFLKKIYEVRERELLTLRKMGYLSSAQSFTWSCTPFLVSLTSFWMYTIVSGQTLTSEKVFVALSLFNLLQFPLSVFPNVISATIDASVSFYRLYHFFTSEELDKTAVLHESMTVASAKPDHRNRLIVDNGTFRWDRPESSSTTETEAILSEINFSLDEGQLMAVVGRVGDGKSSLLSAILGEMYKDSGLVRVRGNVAYVPQNAWIMNATVRDNILFGNPYNPQFYKEVIAACGLKPDLEILTAGDLTEIGERGINLSGGQKQRISLARAVYSRADIYLLDDPLSAVDAHVGRHIFDHVVGPHGILKDKARLFVTHGIHFLPSANVVMMLSKGRILEMGTYAELMNKQGAMFNLMKEYGKRREDTKHEPKATLEANKGPEALAAARKESVPQVPVAPVAPVVVAEKAARPANAQLISKEESAKGSVSWEVYKTYAESCTWTTLGMYLVLAIIGQGLSVGQNVFLADWARSNDAKRGEGQSGNDDLLFRLGIYGALGALFSLTTVGQVIFVWVYCAIHSARKLHKEMLENVIALPQSFFDTTPLGRILNRFSKDQYTVDEVLPRSFQGYLRTLFVVLSVLLINSIGSPLFLAFVIPLGFLYLYFQRFYLSTSRELKRLDSSSRSPIYTHFQETLGGVTSIRAYSQETRFIHTNEDRLDFNQRAYYPSVSSNRWLAVRLECIGSLVVFSSALFSVLSVLVFGTVSASLVGLTLTYAMTVTQTLNWMVRQSCEIESNIVSVERIKEYIDVAREAPYEIPEHQPPASWPRHGAIEFKNYSTRYRPGLDLVLKNLSFNVRPKEKIGIVGRTGAGKSSLTLSLFRIIEASSGTIAIDGIDISAIGLFDLRSKITVIPQDPVLFSGTIRDNLDPFGQFSDDQIWRALESSSLSGHVASLEAKLMSPVLPGGENFSVGQRQLICLARALLRKSSILVLDEATAAIDVETDNTIQKTIRAEFSKCTILTIAHRINTVMDSDRIMVLDRGQIVEFDSPKTLLQNKKSVFYSLAREAGQAH
ncbi:P-loop containing nucleoside triphosphate hydrolase protein [Polychytrium aggregatum]|uniref:P-loop containing nucleoside triphosphate hydrolase protein n=1 Tax=Polychytrium aggregatum TaxID=110093 RepID=UPI0022FDCB50|nr:P-loop containing nucleoside triphosphate hydrolase protein [Polychytrium aggregatum]KAI9207232.1 P-loop containing nucleoside triphosphate hydrolase protein [Polychytrium aggregatum]